MSSMLQQILDYHTKEAERQAVEIDRLTQTVGMLERLNKKLDRAIIKHDAKMSAALDIIEAVAASQDMEICLAYREMAVAFLEKWAEPESLEPAAKAS